MTTTTTRTPTIDSRRKMGLLSWQELLHYAEWLWSDWHRDRLHLLTRCVRLEAALYQACGERDDWCEIARQLAHWCDEAAP